MFRIQSAERRAQSAGFTLIEVMVTVVILSLGTLVIHEGLLRSADVLVHTNSQLVAEEWFSDKTWDVEESLFFSEEDSEQAASGTFTEVNRNFDWSVATTPVSGGNKLYLINLNLLWHEGNKEVHLNRAFYATFKK